ncbi:MAG: hypothetical protein NXI31_27225 [bacterium]|nr:hypothetical protein [bacterium]
MTLPTRSATLPVLGITLLALSACALRPSSMQTVQECARPATVWAFRYLVDAVTERGNAVEVPMIYLPNSDLVSEVLIEFNPAPDDPLRVRYLARPLSDISERHKRLAQDTEAEPCELPHDFVEQLIALERLTANSPLKNVDPTSHLDLAVRRNGAWPSADDVTSSNRT